MLSRKYCTDVNISNLNKSAQGKYPSTNNIIAETILSDSFIIPPSERTQIL